MSSAENKINKSKPIGFFSMLSMVVGTMIGIGIFIAPAKTTHLGFYGAISCILAGLLCIGLAIMFGELSKISFASGPAGFTFQAFGKFACLEVTILHWLSFICAQVLTVYTLGLYVNIEYMYIIGITGLLGMAFINTLFPSLTDSLQNVFTILKVSLVLLVIIMGMREFHIADCTFEALTMTQTFKRLLAGLAAFLVAFSGLELATLPTGEIKNPKFTVPAATIFGTIITTILTASVYIVVINVLLKYKVAITSRPVYDGLSKIFPEYAMPIFILVFAIACLSSVNGLLSAQAYILKNASSLNILPEIFQKNNTSGRPVYSIIFSVITVMILLGLLKLNLITVDIIVSVLSISVSIVYLFSVMSYLKMNGSKSLWALNLFTVLLFIYSSVSSSISMIVITFILILIGFLF